MDALPNIVLVHGARADGSCWSGVIERLQADGYHVTAPQFPMTALADDVSRLRHVLDLQDGPAIVAGHSYGQAIPPDAERLFASRIGATTIEVPASHVAMVSHPAEVTQLITAAAETCAATA